MTNATAHPRPIRKTHARLSKVASARVVADPKVNPVPHPALEIERRAQDEIRKWGSGFVKPRRR